MGNVLRPVRRTVYLAGGPPEWRDPAADRGEPAEFLSDCSAAGQSAAEHRQVVSDGVPDLPAVAALVRDADSGECGAADQQERQCGGVVFEHARTSSVPDEEHQRTAAGHL